MAETVVLYLRDMAHRVSPFLTVYRIGDLLFGFALTVGFGRGLGLGVTAAVLPTGGFGRTLGFDVDAVGVAFEATAGGVG